MWPPRIPDLYAGEPVVLTARLPVASGSVRVRGQRGATPFETTVDLGPDTGAPWTR